MKTLDEIATAVCAEFEVTAEELRRRNRAESVLKPRFAFYWLAISNGLSPREVSAHVGRTRSMVSKGYRIARNRLDTETPYKNRVDRLLEGLK